ncbi:unnamed protein product, partial [Brenthis ino]
MMCLRNTEKDVIIKAPWGNIAALTWGNSNNPPVLFGSGRMIPCSAIRPLVMRLPQNFFYIAFDFPGNGYSDHLPKGGRFTIFDLIPSLLRVAEHYKYEKFAYIGHSLGTLVGKFFDLVYPGVMTRIVDLDPVPAYVTVLPEGMPAWYKEIYGDHYEERAYKKHISGKETAPKYTVEQVREMIMASLVVREEAANHIINRNIEPAGQGLYRFTYDQRMKSTFILPFTPDSLKQLYTRSKTPTLAIFASRMIEIGAFSETPFALDEKAWVNGNYKYKIVEGDHNVHLDDPDCMAEDISKFLLEEFKAKL